MRYGKVHCASVTSDEHPAVMDLMCDEWFTDDLLICYENPFSCLFIALLFKHPLNLIDRPMFIINRS